ncbi:hypothetical protein, partial [Brucella endophytica]
NHALTQIQFRRFANPFFGSSRNRGIAAVYTFKHPAIRQADAVPIHRGVEAPFVVVPLGELGRRILPTTPWRHPPRDMYRPPSDWRMESPRSWKITSTHGASTRKFSGVLLFFSGTAEEPVCGFILVERWLFVMVKPFKASILDTGPNIGYD